MTGSLAGKRILVIEDEYFIAADLKLAFQREDAVVVGPAGEVGRGLALLDDGPVDAAVLDVNLEGTTSYAIADRLAASNTPYMFLTGYDGWALPDAYQDVPRVPKPFTAPVLVRRVSELLDAEHPA